MKHFLIAVVIIFCTLSSQAQYERLQETADSLYSAKAFLPAAKTYLAAAKAAPKIINLKGFFYNAACCYALANNKKAAIKYLKLSVNKHGYKNYQHLLQDTDLNILHDHFEWSKITAMLKEQEAKLSNPEDMQLVTTDIDHFWEAYNAAQKDTANRKAIFTRLYFNRASPGLQDYFLTKIGSIDRFIKNQEKNICSMLPSGKTPRLSAVRK